MGTTGTHGQFGLLGRANGSPVKTAAVNIDSATTTVDIVAGVSGKKIKVLGWVITGSGTTPTLRWEDSGTAYTGDMRCANGNANAPLSEFGWFTIALAGAGLDAVTTGTSPLLDGVVVYVLVD